MQLPRIDIPTYEYKLYSTKKKIKYRPFLVGEQEILLQAKPASKKDLESNSSDIIRAMTQILEQCTFGKVDIRSLPMFDVIMLFIKIRSKSVDNILKITYAYDYVNPETNEKKEEHVLVNINTDDICIKEEKDHDKVIYIDDSKSIGIGMKYPSWKMVEDFSDKPATHFIVSCFDTIFTGEDVIDCSESTVDELVEWYKQLPFRTQQDIDKFFNTIPTVYYSTEVKLKDGRVKTMEYKNLNDFFTL